MQSDKRPAVPSLLARELKKKKGFDAPEQEAYLNLVRVNDQLQIHFARLFRTRGITVQQYNILRILRGEGKPLPILEIAQRMVTVVPGITGLIDRLEKARLAARKRCQEDRRVIYVELAGKGQKVLAELDQPVLELHRQLMGHMSRTEIQDLIRLLEKVRAPWRNVPPNGD